MFWNSYAEGEGWGECRINPVRNENEGTSFSELKVNRKELAAAWTCQPEAMVSDTRDRSRDNGKAPQTTCRKGLPGSQMLLLEEYLLWLGIWVQCFPFKEEKEGGKRQPDHCLLNNELRVQICVHTHTYALMIDNMELVFKTNL